MTNQLPTYPPQVFLDATDPPTDADGNPPTMVVEFLGYATTLDGLPFEGEPGYG